MSTVQCAGYPDKGVSVQCACAENGQRVEGGLSVKG